MAMRVGRPTAPVILTVKERDTLVRWARQRKARRALAQRARIVLACAAGQTNSSIGARAGVTRQTVGRWRRRFVRGRLSSLVDLPRAGAPRRITDAQRERVVRLSRAATPGGARRWSTRAMARRCGLSQTAVCRIWRAWRVSSRGHGHTR
jgi:transposase